MNEQIEQIAARIRELREILEISQQEVADKVGIPLAEYQSYENATDDIPIGVLYAVAGEFGVDTTVLMTGEGPRMDEYTIVRGGNGVKVDRYAGYSFSALAANYKNRDMDPMIVTLTKAEQAELVSHAGQEFNYVLEGTITIAIGKREFTLETGDSIYFNPAVPHGQRAVTNKAKFLTVINENACAGKR
ncbi:XRE family transcriptional regulator [Christensenellaceae bacterium OttesenSCG-928-K19]|nr:XRE family transcriptional regulator [Christensenellaceae bacterium OttesenSCG-928-K19]